MRERAAHNIYIKTAAEGGVPALVILLLMFYFAFRQSRRVFLDHPDPFAKTMARGAFGVTLSLFISNLTTASFQDTEVVLSFYVLTGMVAVLIRQGGTAEAAGPVETPRATRLKVNVARPKRGGLGPARSGRDSGRPVGDA